MFDIICQFRPGIGGANISFARLSFLAACPRNNQLLDNYIVILIIIGAAILGMAWMPAITERIKLSYSFIYLAFGALLYSLPGFLPSPDPIVSREATLHLSELVVIVSLMGTGLKIDQRFSFRTWHVPFRLMSINMLLCIGGMMAVCIYFLDFNPVLALLIAAVLSPTDPVLATDVQVGAPHEDQPDNVKFSLTAEAGFNDGVAFPFVWLAIVWMGIENGDGGSFLSWVGEHLFYQCIIGAITGIILGKLVAFLIFRLPDKTGFLMTSDGFISIAATLLVYGVTELIQGYGFVAVFIAALTIRNSERHHKFHKRLHEFSEQIERILVAIVLILLGGSLVSGILDHLTWPMAIGGLVFLFVIRPISSYLSLAGTGLLRKEKGIISFFGIRGVGSIFYVAFAYTEISFGQEEEVWSLVSFIILISIVVHGSTAGFFMRKLEKELPDDTNIIA
jgi:sodium/hydrogen antiporter